MPDPKPIDVLLLTGYLGAGKTTLLNRLLDLPRYRDRKTALLINEFGQMGIDGQLVKPGPWPTVELNKGNLFCVCVKTDFIDALAHVADEIRPESLIIEATGVAETADLEQFLAEPSLAGKYRVFADVCVTDATAFAKVAPHMRAARRQAQYADGIVINKADLADPEDLRRLRNVLAQMNERAPQVAVSYGQIPADFLDSLTHVPQPAELAEGPPENLVSVSLSPTAPADREGFAALIGEYGDDLLRLKGHVDFGEGLRHVEWAGGRLTDEPAGDNAKPGLVVIAFGRQKVELMLRFSQTWQGA